MIAGHRGAASLAPENTLSAFKKALQSGAKWIELDTQLSADKIPVIFHDETVDRCTNGEGLVADFTFSQLQALDTGSWFSAVFIGEQIISLEQTLLFFMENDLNMNLEIKVHHSEQAEPLVDAVSKVLAKVNFPNEKLIISSFSELALAHCHRVMPSIRLGYITDKNPLIKLEKLKPLNLYSVHIDHKILEETMAKKVTDSGLKLIIWTLNDVTQADKFRSWGVEMIITDKPDVFVKA
ncbi:glycerophosphoryl diester phosphodiesterase [Psychromonas sp. B3M02]|uniref:glycerophosphodiester phosphodiesterase family protein n=1 Tax=Psychromonas sp. B3M02 TaxID=2267226 RepID=UPI000DEBB401|nr:glycerophosphodiester phosphodiesterase family protein [Psychromonas sp. B3M02]RBW47012.1 glycerophosphoryl diester phosphodiesterase [Psychromonas sp. B3M02]